MTSDTFSPDKLYVKLISNTKNLKLQMFNDYYEGKHWLNYNYLGVRQLEDVILINTTRSGKAGWKRNKENPKEKGIPQGLIKTWNLIKMMVDTYANYTRGNSTDFTKVEGYDLSKIIPDLDSFIINACKHLSIAGFCAIEKKEEKIEIQDPRSIFPVYSGSELIAIVKAYETYDEEVKRVAEEYDTNIKTQETNLSWDIYFFDGVHFSGVNDVVTAEEKNIFIPIQYVENDTKMFTRFDCNDVPLGDIEANIDIQDDINIFETDINIINRYIAFPMKKLADKVFEKMVEIGMTSDDINKLREDLSRVSLEAGKLLSAPIENLDSNPLADSTINHLNDMLEQFYRQTGIPKSVFNSEGLGQIATDTIQFMTESLRKKVEHKRTKITTLIKKAIQLDKEQYEDDEDIIVHFAPMYEPSLRDKLAVVEAGDRLGMPKSYSIKKILSLLGDTEDVELIIESIETSNQAERLRIENMIRRNETKSLPQTRPEEPESKGFVAELVAKAGL